MSFSFQIITRRSLVYRGIPGGRGKMENDYSEAKMGNKNANSKRSDWRTNQQYRHVQLMTSITIHDQPSHTVILHSERIQYSKMKLGCLELKRIIGLN